MKTFPFVAVLLLFVSSCNFKKSVGEDLDTDAVFTGNGLACDNITLDINGEVEGRNDFVEGERITVNFNNMEGLTKVGGKFYFGLSIEIKSKSGKLVEKSDDLFADNKGYKIDPITPKASFNAGFNDERSKEYVVKIKIWDKKGKGTFNYEMPYSVQSSQILSLRKAGLEVSAIGLFDLSKQITVVKNEISRADEYEFQFSGLQGFRVENEKVFVAASLKVTDITGKEILFNKNVFDSYKDSGVSGKDVEELLSIKFNFGQTTVKNPVMIESVISDLKSGNLLMIKTKMNLK